MPTATAPRVVLDGAHNPQKMAALAHGLPGVLGLPRGARPVVVLGSLEGKDLATSALIAPEAVGLVATRPRVLGKAGAAPEEIGRAARTAGFAGEVAVESAPAEAIERAMAMALPLGCPCSSPGRSTSSVSSASGGTRAKAVLQQRTPWPVVGPR